RVRGARLGVDRVVFGAVLRMPDGPSVEDARETVLASAASLEGGVHAGVLRAALAEHGLGADDTPESDGDDDDGAAGDDDAPGVRFTAPRRRSYVLHTG